MMYLNQFHKEAVERKMKKIAESKKSPMNSTVAAAYMKRNFEKAQTMTELGGKEEDIPYLAHTAAYGNEGDGSLGRFVELKEEDIENIYRLML